ncbi:MAG: hypothetical protein R3E89_07085 [Thiolinea sp.]
MNIPKIQLGPQSFLSLPAYLLAAALLTSLSLTVHASDATNTHRAARSDASGMATASQATRSAPYPRRGMSMQQVRKHYGEPQRVRQSSGKVKKNWPRITVWEYGAFSVYFERKTTLHTVIHH